jgi:hypothetical protein
MPSPTRAKTLHLITSRSGETETPACLIATFKSAYQWALLEGRISKPNLTERSARLLMNRFGQVWIWNLDEFEHAEQAMWSPIGRMIKIQKVPIKGSK